MSASTPPGSQSDLSQSEVREQEKPADADTRPSLYQRPAEGSGTSLAPSEGLNRSSQPSGGPYSSAGGGAGALSSSSLPSSAQPPPLPPPPSITRSAVPLHPPPPPPSLPKSFPGSYSITGGPNVTPPLAAQSFTTSPLPMPPASFTPGLSSSASIPTSRPPSSPFSAPSLYPSPSVPTSRSPSAPGSGFILQPQSAFRPSSSSVSQPSSMSMYRPPTSSASPLGPLTPANTAVSNSQSGSQSMSLPSRPVTLPGPGTPYPLGGPRFAVSNSAVDYSRSPAQQSIYSPAPATFGPSSGSRSVYQQSPAAPSIYQQSPAAPSTYQQSPAPPVTFQATPSAQYPGRPTPVRKMTNRGDVFVAIDPFKTSASNKHNHNQVPDGVTFDDIPVPGQQTHPQPPKPVSSGRPPSGTQRPTSGTLSLYGSTPHSSAPMSQSTSYPGQYTGITSTSRPSMPTPSSSSYTRPQSSSAPGYAASPVYSSQPAPSTSYGGSSTAPAYYGSPSQSQSQPVPVSSPPPAVPAMPPSQTPIRPPMEMTPVELPPMQNTSPMPISSGRTSSSVPADSSIPASTPYDPSPSSPTSPTSPIPNTEQPASQIPRPATPYIPPLPSPTTTFVPLPPSSSTAYNPPTPYNPASPYHPPVFRYDPAPFPGYNPPVYTSPFPDAYNDPYDQPQPGSPNSPLYPPGPLWTRPDSIEPYKPSILHRVLTTFAWIFCLPCMFLLHRRRRSKYSAPWTSDFGDKPTDSKVVLTFIIHTFPRQAYLHILLRLPELYFSRVARIFEEADLTLPEIKKMALETASKGKETHSIHLAFETSSVPPAYESLKLTWESFIDSVMREWKTFNVISVLLLSAILTILQIQSAADDPVVRYSSLFSLICALFSLLFGCMYIIRFGSMRKTYKAAEWALEAKKSRTVVLWNVWILLAMPAIWLTWSLILYIFCIMAFIWRSGTGNDGTSPPPALSKNATLGIRITITIVVAIGTIYGFLILNTFKRYGARMDKAWKERIDGWLDEKAQQQQDGQGPSSFSGAPLSPGAYPPPDPRATFNSGYQTPYDPPQSFNFGSSYPGYGDPSAPEPYRPGSTNGRVSPFLGRVPSYRSTAYPRQGYPYDPDSKHRRVSSGPSTDAYPQYIPPSYIPPSYTYGPFPDKEKTDTSPPPDSRPDSPFSSSTHASAPQAQSQQSHSTPTTPEVPPPSIRYVPSGARPFPGPGLKIPLASPTPSVLADLQPTPNTIANTIANTNIAPPTPPSISLRIDPGHRSTSRSSAYDSAPNTPDRERDDDGERGRLLHSPHVHFVDPSTPSATSQGGGSASSIRTSFGHELLAFDEPLLSRRSSRVGDSPSTSALNPPTPAPARMGSKDTLNSALDVLFQKNKKP